MFLSRSSFPGEGCTVHTHTVSSSADQCFGRIHGAFYMALDLLDLVDVWGAAPLRTLAGERVSEVNHRLVRKEAIVFTVDRIKFGPC